LQEQRLAQRGGTSLKADEEVEKQEELLLKEDDSDLDFLSTLPKKQPQNTIKTKNPDLFNTTRTAPQQQQKLSAIKPSTTTQVSKKSPAVSLFDDDDDDIFTKASPKTSKQTQTQAKIEKSEELDIMEYIKKEKESSKKAGGLFD